VLIIILRQTEFVKIRKAVPQDANSIANLLLLAMEDIIYEFIGESDKEKAIAFLIHFAQSTGNQYSYQNCYVMVSGAEIIAAANVYDGAKLHAYRQPIADYIATRFNRELIVEDETQAGEYYIDSIGVSERFQGKGIGSEILKFLIDEHVIRRKGILGLLVDKENIKAKKLYLKLGFCTVNEMMLTGKRMEHLQISIGS